MKPLADIIDIAINKYLWDGTPEDASAIKEHYSCAAVRRSFCSNGCHDLGKFYFLKSFGCNTSSSNEFDETPRGEQRQYARAMWLTWAAMIAREEGL